MHYQNLKKRNDYYAEQPPRNYSLLGYSGANSLTSSRGSLNEATNPYFPHRIRDTYDSSNSTRFTGNRSWNYTPNPQIALPDPKS